MSRYRWEDAAGLTGRYRDTRTGRFVSPGIVRKELDTYLSAGDDTVQALADALRNREISLADFELAARRLIKNTHLNAIALERGGYANMTPADYGRAGQIIRQQYAYMKNFALDIASGKQRIDGTLSRRLRLYAQAGRNSFYRSHAGHLPGKVTHQRSIRTKRDSCWQCIELDRKVFAINDSSFPLPGRRVCNHNCGCHLEYLSMVDGEYVSLEMV